MEKAFSNHSVGLEAENTKAEHSVAAISLPAARLSLTSTAVFIVLVAALHFLKPDFDPSWRFISEYAIGDYGWVMVIAFFFWVIGHIGLFAAIRTQVPTVGGKIGVWLLLVIAAELCWPVSLSPTPSQQLTPNELLTEHCTGWVG